MNRLPVTFAIVSVGLMALACRPIVAIGWPELIFLVALIIFLLGPLLFRLYRFLDKLQRVKQAEENRKKEG